MIDRTEASKLLWHDRTCFDKRWRKSAATLVAVQHQLRRLHPLDDRERDFLQLYARVEAAGAAVFTRVWRDPRSYLWARLADEFLNACLHGSALSDLAQRTRDALGGGSLRETLSRHLDQFKMFALAVAIQAGEDLRFAVPWQPPLPFAIPATPWSISAVTPLTITGLERGCLLVDGANGRQRVPLDPATEFSAHDLVRHRCPDLRHNGCDLLVQPHAFHVSALRDVTTVVSAGITFQWQHADLLVRTLDIMQRYDAATFDQFRQFVSLVAVKPRPESGTSNTSHSQLPGAFMASVVNNPLAMAQNFIHEFCHNRLFAIEEEGPFFDPKSNAHRDARYYSPWRADPRPLHGILHALYVFTCVNRYWLNVYRDAEIRGGDRDYVTQRLRRIQTQLDFGAQMLQRHAIFSELGHLLFTGLLDDIADLHSDMSAYGVPPDAPALIVEPDGGYAPQLSLLDGRPISALEGAAEHRAIFEREYPEALTEKARAIRQAA